MGCKRRVANADFIRVRPKSIKTVTWKNAVYGHREIGEKDIT